VSRARGGEEILRGQKNGTIADGRSDWSDLRRRDFFAAKFSPGWGEIGAVHPAQPDHRDRGRNSAGFRDVLYSSGNGNALTTLTKFWALAMILVEVIRNAPLYCDLCCDLEIHPGAFEVAHEIRLSPVGVDWHGFPDWVAEVIGYLCYLLPHNGDARASFLAAEFE
jgi:hypothetical protein